MNGKEKLIGALSTHGTDEVGAVMPYEGIYIRDHWDELTIKPWWFQYETDIGKQLQWHSEVIENIEQDWFILTEHYSDKDRSRIMIKERKDRVFRIDKLSKSEKKLEKPRIGGSGDKGLEQSVKPDQMADTYGEVEKRIPEPEKEYTARQSIKLMNCLADTIHRCGP